METVLHWDKQALIWMNGHHNVVLDAILAPIAFAGEMAVFWFALALVMLAIGKPGYRAAAITLIVTIILVDRLFAGPLQQIVGRTRPYLAMEGIRAVGVHWKSGSFPSGHAHSVWIAAVVLGSRWPRLVWPLIAVSLLTLYSRPYFGMHYPLDTVFGSLLGIGGGFCAVEVQKTFGLYATAWSARRNQAKQVEGTVDGQHNDPGQVRDDR